MAICILFRLPGYYYDYLNTEKLYKDWTPAHIGKEVFPEKHKQIKGGMFAVWNDHAGNGISTKDIHYRVSLRRCRHWLLRCGQAKTVRFLTRPLIMKRTALGEGPGVNIAGRMGSKPRAVYNQDVLKPNTKTGLKRRYHYTVSFDVQSVKEEPEQKLFRSRCRILFVRSSQR